MQNQFESDANVQAIEKAVAMIDPQMLLQAYAGVGSPPHSPECMLKIALYEMLDGRPSPAQWSRDASKNDALKFLARFIQPSRSSCYAFRDRAAAFVDEAHKAMLTNAIKDKLHEVKEVVVDGTYFRACASRHRLLNQETIEKRRIELEKTIRGETEQQTNAAWMARTENGRLEQSERYKKASSVLIARIEENAKRPKDKQLQWKRILVSTSDPEAPISRDKEKVFGPIYNAQYVVDPKSRVILASDTFARATDVGTIGPMLDRTMEVVGNGLEKAHADSAYSSIMDVQECVKRRVELFAPVQENRGTSKSQSNNASPQVAREQFTYSPEDNSYTCPQGHRMPYIDRAKKRRMGDQTLYESRYKLGSEVCQACPLMAGCLKGSSKSRTVRRLDGQELIDELRAKMATESGKASRVLRSQTVERTFGDTKQNRNIRRLHCRSLRRAKTEIALVVMAQNALTLYRMKLTAGNPDKNTT